MDRVITVATKTEKTDKNGKLYFQLTDTEGREWNIFDDKDRVNVIPGAGLKLAFQTEVKGEWENVVKGSVKVMSYSKPAINRFNPEEMKTRSAALSYAKDLVIADKIALEDAIQQAADFYKWLSEEKAGNIE
jgi:hypothetical protein